MCWDEMIITLQNMATDLEHGIRVFLHLVSCLGTGMTSLMHLCVHTHILTFLTKLEYIITLIVFIVLS